MKNWVFVQTAFCDECLPVLYSLVVVSSTHYMYFLSSHTLMSEQYVSFRIQIAFQLAGVLNKQYFRATTSYTYKMQTADTGMKCKLRTKCRLDVQTRYIMQAEWKCVKDKYRIEIKQNTKFLLWVYTCICVNMPIVYSELHFLPQ